MLGSKVLIVCHVNFEKNMNCFRAITLIILFLSQFATATLQYIAAEGETSGIVRRLRVPVLMYHYVSTPPDNSDKYRLDLSVTPDNFRRQMQWLKENGYHTVTPDDLLAALQKGRKLPNQPVMITFDDGYIDAYTNAFPILRLYGFKGTFFVVTQWLDENRSDYISWDQANEMLDWGMSIQSHSRRHYDMRDKDHDWLVYEILGSIESIEAHTGVRPRTFCYPAGEFDINVIRELRAAGIDMAFTTNDGTMHYSDDMLRMPRVRIRGTTTIPVFANLMTWQR
jgi:peptidoglycan/xylan/chitin deacetylase (PgdA/CDA1 family)